MKIILASNNAGKIFEIQALLRDQNIEVIPQSQYAVTEIAETGLTFVENALIKARHAANVGQLPSMADDSGLVVPVLGRMPGIFSARYAGDQATSAENIEKLLRSLEGVPEKERQAFFFCVIVMMMDSQDPCPLICQGIWHGTLLTKPRGVQGFGYDPIFYDAQYQCSAAELPLEIKNKISHRGQAMQALLKSMF